MSTPDRAHPAIAPRGHTHTVLVAEDDLTSRELLRRTIVRWGYPVLTAADGDAALRCLEENAPRLLISDWEMPGLSGLDLCRRVRGRDSPAPGARPDPPPAGTSPCVAEPPKEASRANSLYTYVVLLTSHAGSENVVRGLEAGADDFLAKPFQPAELRARLAVGERILQLEDQLRDASRELEAANHRLQTLALTDHLMGIGNRRSFEESIHRVHSHARRHQVPYGVLIADVDHFKTYNDRYGHQAGDHVLATVAASLRAALRVEDQLFRYGGEELAVVLPSQRELVLPVVADRLRLAVQRCGIVHAGNEAGVVTMSVGGASYDPAVALDETWPQVVSRADRALYLAKQGGRNRSALWPAITA